MATYRFVEWRDEVGNVWTTPSITLLIDRDKTLTAHYEEIPPTIYTLTIATTIGGTTEPAPGSYEYDEGATAMVAAVPETGYYFNHWMLDGETRTENPINIVMDKDYTLQAVFTVTPPPAVPPVDISTIAGVALAVADAALIGYYLATLFGLI